MSSPSTERGVLESILAEIRRGNEISEAILAKVSAVITVRAVQPNSAPQYTGPTSMLDLVVGQARALEGFDPDGDQITWSVDPASASKVSVTPGGALTPLVPLNDEAVTVWLDDGKA